MVRAKVGQFARRVPVQLHAKALQLVGLCGQQLAVVELAFARQVHALGKARGQCGLDLGHALRIQRLHGGQFGHQGARGIELLAHARGFRGVLAVPHQQRTFLLKKHRLRQRCNQLGPARKRVAPHAHHAVFGHGRFGQRRNHAARHARGRVLGQRAALVVQADGMALARQGDGQQAAQQASAQDGEGGVSERHGLSDKG